MGVVAEEIEEADKEVLKFWISRKLKFMFAERRNYHTAFLPSRQHKNSPGFQPGGINVADQRHIDCRKENSDAVAYIDCVAKYI